MTVAQAQILLIALDVCREMGWDGSPFQADLVAAEAELLAIVSAGDESPFEMPVMGPKSSD